MQSEMLKLKKEKSYL